MSVAARREGEIIDARERFAVARLAPLETSADQAFRDLALSVSLTTACFIISIVFAIAFDSVVLTIASLAVAVATVPLLLVPEIRACRRKEAVLAAEWKRLLAPLD